MTDKSTNYIRRLRSMYQNYPGYEDDLEALVEAEKMDQRIRELKVYREQPKTQELIVAAIGRFRTCVEKLVNPESSMKMNDTERAECFAMMDWARFTLDMVGEDPTRLEQEVENIITGYARRAGLSP